MFEVVTEWVIKASVLTLHLGRLFCSVSSKINQSSLVRSMDYIACHEQSMVRCPPRWTGYESLADACSETSVLKTCFMRCLGKSREY